MKLDWTKIGAYTRPVPVYENYRAALASIRYDHRRAGMEDKR